MLVYFILGLMMVASNLVEIRSNYFIVCQIEATVTFCQSHNRLFSVCVYSSVNFDGQMDRSFFL